MRTKVSEMGELVGALIREHLHLYMMIRLLQWMVYCFVIFGCGNSATSDRTTEGSVATRTRPVLTDTLVQQLQQVLAVYFELEAAFVAADTGAINHSAAALATQLNSLPLSELQVQDTVLYAQVYGRPGDATAELEAMIAENSLQQKRASFEMVSTVLYDLLIALQPRGVKVYHQYCPMAFEDKGAYWISATDSIRNPYFGSKMLHCGEVKAVLAW